MKKGLISAAVIFLAAAVILTGIGIRSFVGKAAGCALKAAVLYAGDKEDYIDSLSHLEQSMNACLEAEAVLFDKNTDLSKYDLIYPDESIIEGLDETGVEAIRKYVEDGGFFFASNEFLTVFEPEFFGGSERVKIASFPESIDYPEVSENYDGMQSILKDFEKLYRNYHNFDELKEKDYGYGIRNEDAAVLAKSGDVSLYGVNAVGKGYVFYTNPMLPNVFTVNGFVMKSRNDTQDRFANTTATANQIIKSEFAGFAAKIRYGFSVERVNASFASPAAAWQLHYEEKTAFQNDSAGIFGELCREYGQIPSFTIIRNTYRWYERAETVTYYLSEDGKYNLDFNENAYSSGTHIVVDDSGYLKYNFLENGGSYFADYPENKMTAYPAVGDYNGDGVPDVISGSSDGFLYYNEGVSFKDGEWRVKGAMKLSDNSGNVLQTNLYSAPAAFDMNGAGGMDLAVGSADGNVIWLSGWGGSTFGYEGNLIENTGLNHAMPAIGDIDGDGTEDMVIGSIDGAVQVYKGERKDGRLSFTRDAEKEKAFAGLEGFAAPGITDIDGDGKNDVLIGSFDGYIDIFLGNGLEHGGKLKTNEMNYKGNDNLKVGNNCVPLFYDLNGDGQKDLVAGSLEYGVAMPIDSPYYADRDKLQEQINYMKDNYFYAGLHFYTNSFASPEREKTEIELHKKALKSYGLDVSCVGSNQHTWHTSTRDNGQTFHSLKDNGIMWSSGFIYSDSYVYPESSAESTLANTFFLDYKNRSMMMLGTNTLLNSDFGDAALKYDLPISIYYHCDFAYKDPNAARETVERVQKYVSDNDYAFVREDQLMKAAAASYNAKVRVKNDDGKIEISQKASKKGFGLYNKNYQKAVGVKIEFAEGVKAEDFLIDANVWRRDGNSVYVGLDKKVVLTKGEAEKKPHITKINIPAKVKLTEDGAEVDFKDDGLMQVFVNGEAEADKSWTKEYKDGVTKLYKFGKREKVTLRF